jgi:hypothetical protein
MRNLIALTAAGVITALCAGGAQAQVATQDINITATVLGACTINNVATGSPVGTATIPVNAAGAVTTTAITPTGSPFANVACNAASNLQLTSLNGGVRNTGTPGAGFTNIINYQASATWNAVTANINTATNPAAAGAETGAVAAVATAHAGNLTVTITPTANALPLITGSYTDTLRVTLTPQ